MSSLLLTRLSFGLRMATARKLFGANLARLADRPGFSRKGLAEFLGVHPQVVSRWISGKILPTKYLDSIAAYFKVPVKELFAEPLDPLPQAPQPIDLTAVEALKIVASDYGYVLRTKHKK